MFPGPMLPLLFPELVFPLSLVLIVEEVDVGNVVLLVGDVVVGELVVESVVLVLCDEIVVTLVVEELVGDEVVKTLIPAFPGLEPPLLSPGLLISL